MENNIQPHYTSFKDLMSSRYELTDEQIEEMLKQHPNLTDFEKYHIMDKIDYMEFFGITAEMIAAFPKVLFKGDNTIVNKCKLAYICNIDPTPEYIFEYHNMRNIMRNYRASKQGKLPRDIDLNSPIKNTAGFAGFNDNDSYIKRFNVLGITYAIDKEFNELFPELNIELNEYFPQYAYNRENAIAHRKVPIEERKRKKLKNKIKQLWANDEMIGKSKPAKVPLLSGTNDGVVYSTANYHEEIPLIHEIKNLKDKKPQTPNIPESEAVTNVSTHKQEPLSNNPSVEDKQNFSTENDLDSMAKQNSSTISSEMPLDQSNEIKEKQKFYEKEFGLTEKEFYFKLEKTNIFVSQPCERILAVKDKLINDLNFSDKNLHDYVLYTANFPVIENSIESMKQKIEMLNKLGISLDTISINFKALTRNITDLELRAKLAFINNLPVETFLVECHFISPSVIWSRMKAFEKGLIRDNKYYVSSESFYKSTGYKAGDLINMFPLTDISEKEINLLYKNLKAQGKTWRNSYKYTKRFKDLENTTEQEMTKQPAQNEPIIHSLEEQESIFNEIRSFGNDDIEPISKTRKTTIKEPLTQEKKIELRKLFECSDAELDKMIARYKSIETINIESARKLETYLFDNFNITHDDFTLAIRSNPRLARKNIKNFEAYRIFLKDYLLYDERQVKSAIISSSTILTKDPEDILERTYIIARKFKIPFKKAAEVLLTSPEAYIGDISKLEEKIDTLLSLGIPKNELIENLNILSATNKNVKFKYMLAKLNGRSDANFLTRDYFISDSKAYARTMFNLMNNEDLNVYACEKEYKKQLELAFSHLEKLPSFVEEDKPSEYLKQLYPLGPVQKKQIENMYNLKFNKQIIKLNEEELEYGN